MATKNTRLIYNDEKNLMVYDSLQPEDFKEFMMAYLTYKPGDNMSEYFSNPYVYALFLQYTDKIDYNEAKWANKAKANAENGKKGGRPKKNAEIEPNKGFEEEKPVTIPQEPEKPVEQPKNNQEMAIELKKQVDSRYQTELNKLVQKKYKGNDIMDDVIELCYNVTDDDSIVLDVSNMIHNTITESIDDYKKKQTA